ncbi:hypothetical protein IWW37_002230 [Coemansia sp. RSA 2050]|nr:hypothetical protein IWW37_002230 [Coemansia sp. RSA 2050]KAJ2734641.1 hypothetical protein IW152_002196 [Coemansia sp. BCRC 34962]
MEGLSGKELDDSIFGTDSHLDWAEEVNTLEALNDDRFGSSASRAEEPNRQRPTSPPRHSYETRRESRDAGRDSRNLGRRQQNERQSRPDARPPRPSNDSGGNYGRSASRGEYSGRGSSGGSRGSGNRPHGGRSASRVGGSGPPSSQQPTQQGYSQSSGINIRSARNVRDRSRSMERSGSLDHGRGWRGLPSMGRSRADNADRWEHDKYEGAASAPSTNLPRDRGYSRDRRHSGTTQSTAPLPVDIEYIGKEGISHVTINRRESNASTRGYPSASYEAPRRQFPDIGNAPPLPISDEAIGSSARARKASVSQAAAATGDARPVSPRSPGTNEPYRAPHRRQSSVDATKLPPPPLPPIQAVVPPQSSVPEEPLPTKPAVGEAEDNVDEPGSAEMEWENFVANGGLDMPIDRITDDLLKQPHSRSQSVLSPVEAPRPAYGHRDPISHSRMGSTALEKTLDRAALLLSNDGDDDDVDDVEVNRNTDRPDSSFEKSEEEAEQKAWSSGQGISIRGSAGIPPPAASMSQLEDSMTSLALNMSTAPRARQPSGPNAERIVRKGSAPPQQAQASDSGSLGIRIKGSSAKLPAAPVVNGRASAPAVGSCSPARAPTRPALPDAAGIGARSATPARPATPPTNRSASRSSSGDEGRTPVQGAAPSSYLRRQYEVYDECRGRHLFSVNIPYDEGRYAPIHIHERDDLSKLASKFARTWRVHNKEQRIKILLTKVKALMQEASL